MTRSAKIPRLLLMRPKKMGLKIKMVTGDQVAIAKEIGRQLDLGKDIIDASLFDETKPHQDGQLADAIERCRWLCPGLPGAQVPHR